MRDAGLLVDGAEKTRTLYSLRHTYATQALLARRTDIHTLSKQMGNSAAMIERHYSKLTATMAADRLAWGWGVVLNDMTARAVNHSKVITHFSEVP